MVFKKDKNNKKGFTLVELVVTLFLIIIILSLSIVNYNAGYSDTNLSNTQNSLYNNIKLIQSYALSNQSYNNTLPYYWGMYIESGATTSILFADLNNNGLHDTGEYDIYKGGKEIVFSPDIKVSNIKILNDSSVPDLYIMFESGSGDLYVYNSTSSNPTNVDDWYIELQDEKFPLGRLLILAYPGMIDSQNCSCDDLSTWCCSFCSSSVSCSNY
jgi:type II secretory pathway pseudopilin PulG